MAKVSLRIYNREIEGFIDQGNTNEAIAHCHQILKTFSKHLATYRLLGKAYLESKQYAEAVDIFGRVLMAVPDDFVAHVGMSIIHDEGNKLDDAIWHMQRAFESQPSNSAIQGELQRLYGRRDGMEPPKIRMTRGALAQMYVQGELYPQAIAEIKAVLSQEPERADMQVLLARAYFRAGQKADASDMCAQLLKRYLYCFDANRIMVDLLPSTSGATENTQVYRMRVGELDPYATFAKGSAFNVDEVADAAINLERLDYKEDASQTGQEWGGSLGLKPGGSSSPMLTSSSSSDQPDWLKAGGFSDSQSNSQPASTLDSFGGSQSTDSIPDFLRDAGWGESNSPEQPTSIFDPESGGGDLTPAEMPDWLKGQAPSNENPQSGFAQPIETPDWLSGLGGAQAADSFDSIQPMAAQSADTPDWLSGLGGVQAVDSFEAGQPAASAASSETPDWLSGLGNSQTSEPDLTQSGNGPDSLFGNSQSEDVPDWLSGLGAAQSSDSMPAAAPTGDVPDWLAGLGDVPSTESAQAGNTPDWLAGLGEQETSQPIQPGNVPDWLAGLGDDQAQTSQSIQPGNVPDWLAGLGDAQPEPVQSGATIESLGSTAQEQDDAVAWLESLAVKHGAKAEELVTDPNKRSDATPEWVSQAQNMPVASAPSVESLGSTAQEQDDAVAWLESLAAKHGAKPEELVTDPNKRSETPPEWVSQAQNIPAQTPAASVESLGSTAQEQDDAVAWLESLAAKHGAKPEELVTDPNKRFDKPPEWVSQAQTIGEAQTASALLNAEEKSNPPAEVVENALNIGEQFFAEFETASTAAPASQAVDETGMWLRDLEEKENQDDFSAKNASDKGIPDWLSDSSEPQSAAAQKSDLPNWMSDDEKDSDQKDIFANQVEPQNDLSDWLSGLDDEPGLPFDQVPTLDSILAPSSSPAKPPKQEPASSSKPDLPDWLSGMDSQSEASDDEWKKSLPQEPVSAVKKTEKPPVETYVPVNSTENLPSWLQSVDEEESAEVDDDAPWMHRDAFEANEAQQPKPTSPSDWHPVEPKQPMSVPIQEKISKPIEPQAQSHEESPVESRAPAKKKTGLPAKPPRQPEAQSSVTVALNQAKGELDRGDIPTALDHYKKLIKKGKHLEETIRDLSESIYRYPVEVGIWQTLGDAYMRANRLKEALEAYNKAEELIR